MQRRFDIFRAAAAHAIVLYLVGAAWADTPPAPTPGALHATGRHELKLAPQKLRLSLVIRAEGTDGKSALESFMKHKERVKKALLEMKADEASIEFNSPLLTSGIAGVPEEYQSYVPRMFSRGGSQPAKHDPADYPKTFVATSRVKAEWPVPTTDADALALLPETLKQQIKARDLMGEKNKAKLDKAQQEKLEELQAAMQENGGYSSNNQEAQQISILFVAKVDEAARKAALKAAYDQALADANLLAAATGQKLGDLVSLRSEDVLLPPVAADEQQNPYAALLPLIKPTNSRPSRAPTRSSTSIRAV